MTAPIFFLVNPIAGSGRGLSTWRAVEREARRQRLAYEFELTRAPLTGISFVRQALRAGAETIVAVGGDGTVHEAINGFYLDDSPIREGAILAVIPAGQTGRFAHSLGIPAGIRALPLVQTGRVVAVDLGEASFTDSRGSAARRLFGNAAVVGGDPFPMPAPPSFGPMGWTGSLQVDGGDTFLVQARRIVVAVGPYSGSAPAAARAKMDDGLLDVVIETPPSGLPPDLAVAAGAGSEPDARGRHVTLVMDGPSPITLDGEMVGAGSIEMQARPAALRVSIGAL